MSVKILHPDGSAHIICRDGVARLADPQDRRCPDWYREATSKPRRRKSRSCAWHLGAEPQLTGWSVVAAISVRT